MITDENKTAYVIDANGLFLFERSAPNDATECSWLVFAVPPSVSNGHTLIYDRAKCEWSQVEDYRGMLLYNTKTKTKFYKNDVGGLKSGECVYSVEMTQ